jgi:GNAT superfamily N-acetyltransferase
MFYRLLFFLDTFDHDMLPTRNNAALLVDSLFLPAAEKGEAILIAWDDVTPVGAIFWPIQHHAYQSRWITAFGYGTYIDKAYRSRKVGTLLRNEAVRILKEKGVQKLLGVVLFKNEISVKASDRYGFVPYARLDLLDILSYPKIPA